MTKQELLSSKQEYTNRLNELKLPDGVKVGVLLLHGLTGMPNEMRPLSKALEKLGCHVEAPMLPGHGGTHNELLNSGWKDWVGGAQTALDGLYQQCDQVFVGGLSMGALLPIAIAKQNPKVAGLIAMSPTLRYDGPNSSNPFQVLLPLLDIAPFLGKYFYWTEEPPFGIKDERLQRQILKQVEAAKSGEKTDFGQFRTYAGSLRQLQKLVLEVKRTAKDVKCPVVIIHSKDDTITSTNNANTLLGWLGSSDKNLVLLEGCDHVLPLDLKKHEVIYYSAEFICRVARQNCLSDETSQVAVK